MAKKSITDRKRWWPHPKTQRLISQVFDVLDEYDDYLPLTIRQIFYRLVAEHDYPKTELAYQQLMEHLKSARYNEEPPWIVPWEAIRDDGERQHLPHAYDNQADFKDNVRALANDYRINRQANQKYFIELRVEASGGAGLVSDIANAYGVPVYSGGGFDSVTAKHGMIERAEAREQPTIVLHVGDHDPSGLSIFKNIEFEFGEERAYIGAALRVAITPRQAKAAKAPSAPAKRNPHSRGWTGPTWQLEALPPDQLQGIVKTALLKFIDLDIYQKTLAKERRERTRLVNLYKKL